MKGMNQPAASPLRDRDGASNPGQTTGPHEWMAHCFMIFDDLNQEEKAEDEDLLLFFHPSSVPLNLRLFLQGACTAMIHYARAFTQTPLDVLTMERCKMAFKMTGNITILLTAPLEDSDSTLIQQMENIYAAFKFFNRSFDNVLRQCKGTRKELLKEMNRIFKEILPLISHNYHKNLMRSFNPLPYTPLPHRANRHFIQASQILNNIKSDAENLAGCLVYKNSILCTHIDMETTRWVLNRLEFLRSSANFTAITGGANKNGGRSDAHSDFLPVFMPRANIESLNKERYSLLYGEAAAMAMSDGATSGFGKFDEDDDYEDIDGFARLGLFLLSFTDLSLAVIMNMHALSDSKHIKKLRLAVDRELWALQQDLEQITAGPNMPTVAFNTTILPPSLNPALANINYITYDHLTQMATGNSAVNGSDVDFIISASNIHHSFREEPNLTQIIVRDTNGELFAKKIFGREVYYQQKGSNVVHDKFMETVERSARVTFRDEHSINIL